MAIKGNALWAKRPESESDIRCSSVGDDAKKYHDPASVSVEATGRSLASLAPARGHLRGVIVPRASIYGGSRGVNPHKPSILNIIDIDDSRRSFSVDLSQMSKDATQEAYNTVQENTLLSGNLTAMAEEAFNQFAISDEPLPSNIIINGEHPQEERASPVGRGYVVPDANSRPKQANVVRKATEQKKIPTAVKSQIPEVAPIAVSDNDWVPLQCALPPSISVTFEMAGWGTFEAKYHDVIQNDCLLVLVYDNKFESGMKFKPPATDTPITVKPNNLSAEYTVSSTGAHFVHNETTFYILIIESTKPIK